MSQSDFPRVTIGVLSFNRLKYLRVLMESARECIQYPNLEWIVVDGNSHESGLQDYLRSLDYLDHCIVRTCSHAEAMNEIVEKASGKYLLLLPEDVQFIIRGKWLEAMVEIGEKHASVGGIVFNAQRRMTLQRQLVDWYWKWGSKSWKAPFRRPIASYQSRSGEKFYRSGNHRHPIIPAGILSFASVQMWRELGPWKTTKAGGEVGEDSSLGAETEMLQRVKRKGLNLESVVMEYPPCADLITDARGTKARIRGGNRRFGSYMSPPRGQFYYRIWEEKELRNQAFPYPGPSFEDLVQPLGYQLPVDEKGNALKVSVISPDEAYEVVT